jgi:hypothetical protein
LSIALDNARQIGNALTESELPSLEDIRGILGALIYAQGEGLDLGGDVSQAIADLERLKIPQAAQFVDGSVVPERVQIGVASNAELEEIKAQQARTQETQDRILALLEARSAPQPEPERSTQVTTPPIPEADINHRPDLSDGVNSARANATADPPSDDSPQSD